MNLDHVFKRHWCGHLPESQEKGGARRSLLQMQHVQKGDSSRGRCQKNFYVCPSCNGYFRVRAQERIARIADEGSFS